jgi:hypothetical protein
VTAVLTPPTPDPDDRDGDYVTESELRDRGIDPTLVRVLCPWATELNGQGGLRCWAVADLAPLLEGN